MTDLQQISGESEPRRICIHDEAGFAGMRAAGLLAAQTLDYITPFVVPGVTTEEIDRLCHEYITEHGAIAAPLNYRGFPKSICTSVNHVVCHGIPGEKRLTNGDTLNIDVTVILDGWHGDTSRMFTVGNKVKRLAERLIEVTYQSMWRGIEVVRPGATVGDIGHAIQTYVEAERFSVV
ncbi:MAG: type I methionyl aminopeptidase, partial [Alphaproteobacteria bacterium]|nr:type I methionyl aminopeptidase [Alphaproteobacteria bacterium]